MLDSRGTPELMELYTDQVSESGSVIIRKISQARKACRSRDLSHDVGQQLTLNSCSVDEYRT